MKILEFLKDILTYNLVSTKDITINLGMVIAVVLALIATNFILKFLRKLVTRKLGSGDVNKFVSIFQFVKYIIYVLVIIFTLDASGINITVLIAPFAALAVGLGFALQQLFQDIMSGILIIIDKSLHVGDIVEVDDKVGRVTSINLRTSRMETRGGKVLIVPNHKFMSDPLFNWTQNGNTVREEVTVGVAYGSDVELVRDILFKCASHHPGVLEFPEPFVIFENFGDSSLDFGVYFFLPDGFTAPRIKSEIRFEIDKKFRENNISIPFPQRDIHIISQK